MFPLSLTFTGLAGDLGSTLQNIADNPDTATSLAQFTNSFQTAFSDRILTESELMGLGSEIFAIADHAGIGNAEISSFGSFFQNVTLTPQLLSSVFHIMGDYQAALSDKMLTEQEIIQLGVDAVDVLTSTGAASDEILSLFATAGEIFGISDVFQAVVSNSDILTGI